MSTKYITIDDILRVLEEFAIDKDEPIAIETYDGCCGHRHYFDSIMSVRCSEEYCGNVWKGTDPVIWYESKIHDIYRDSDEDNLFVIELEESAER